MYVLCMHAYCEFVLSVLFRLMQVVLGFSNATRLENELLFFYYFDKTKEAPITLVLEKIVRIYFVSIGE